MLRTIAHCAIPMPLHSSTKHNLNSPELNNTINHSFSFFFLFFLCASFSTLPSAPLSAITLSACRVSLVLYSASWLHVAVVHLQGYLAYRSSLQVICWVFLCWLYSTIFVMVSELICRHVFDSSLLRKCCCCCYYCLLMLLHWVR